MRAPVSAASSSGPPNLMASVRRTSSSTNFSWMDSSTMMRAPAEHTCPEWTKPPLRALSTAASKSASAKMTFGFLPPSSRATRFTVSAACLAIILPVTRPPVKETISTSGWVDSGLPAVAPAPVMRFATPAGTPASVSTVMSIIAVCGVSSACLRTKVLPAASAGATFHATCSSG